MQDLMKLEEVSIIRTRTHENMYSMSYGNFSKATRTQINIMCLKHITCFLG